MVPTTLALLLQIMSAYAAFKSGLVLKDPQEVGEVVLTPRPKVDNLPTGWDWREKGLLTADLHQHIPTYCGSCWAHAAMSSIADRIKIQTNGTQRDIIPSIQVLINCGHAGSCNGGDSNFANAWVYKNGGIPDVTCQQYQSKNMECNDMNTCMNCDPDESIGCYPIKNYPLIKVTEYGHVVGEEAIMSEIMTYGPVSCYLNAECLLTYTGGVSMYDNCHPYAINHAIQLNGWGVDENGTKYWIGRNSWGTYWGEKGFFKIVRGGVYTPGVCYWAHPEIGDYQL